jgi:GTP-binding protein
MLPVVAIIGRPNVGKSSLLNRIVGRRVSIVDPTPGVTRDRITAELTLDPPIEGPEDALPRTVEFMDTGGYGVYTADGRRIDDAGMDLAALTPHIEEQIRAATEEADVILFTVDAQSGVTALDETIATMLRRSGQASKAMLVVNKVDGPSWEAHAFDAMRLGFGEPHMVSANNGAGLRRLREAIWERVGDAPAKPVPTEMKVAIVGRRNAGKSSFTNALAGEDRVIVSEIAGTTRDAIDVRFEVGGRTFVAIDTAGVRKRKSWADDVEFYSNVRTDQSIRRADVCLLVLDATDKISQVEKHLAMELIEQAKPTLIVLNKWDLMPKKAKVEDFIEYLGQELPGLDFAPVACVSALTGEGVQDAITMAFNLFQQAGHRETTGKLNALVQRILTERGPSSKLGTIAKIYYITQIEVFPPTIALVVNKPDLFEGNYERYLLNRMREELPYAEVPIRLRFSARKRRENPGDAQPARRDDSAEQ